MGGTNITTDFLTAQEVGAMVVQAATFAAQAALLAQRGASSTLGYTQRQTLRSISQILHSTVSPLTRIGRTLASHTAVPCHEAEAEVPESECCGVLQ